MNVTHCLSLPTQPMDYSKRFTSATMCKTPTAMDQRMTLTPNGTMQQKDLDFESTFAFRIHIIYLL